MASYFGEVIHPSSRAFWNDDDDDDDVLDTVQENADFVIKWTEQEPSQIDKLLIVEGDMMNEFITKCILHNAKSICTIGCEADINNTNVYVIDNVYICTISLKFNVAQAGQFTETIAPILAKANSIYTLTSNYMSHFKSEEEINSESFIKSLYSHKARSNKKLKYSTLNQPNIVTGVCAGVLSYAEIFNLHCIMYILYTDTLTLDSKNSLPLVELFSDLLGKTLPNFTAEGLSFFNKGNLYL